MDNSQVAEFAELMLELRQAMHRQSTLSLEERVGSGLQLTALHHLAKEGSANVSGLAQQLHISLSSATQLAERLVKAEFVERTTDLEDRRITNLALTTTGKTELIQCQKGMHIKMASLLAKLSEPDRLDLIRILRTLTTALAN